MKIAEIEKPDAVIIQQLFNVWEKSVRATHLFLSDLEIKEIAGHVPEALGAVSHLIVAVNDDNLPVGFMGIEGKELEMLFIAPEERGKGLGRQLVLYGIEMYSINQLGVNEQNPEARGFYEHMGFQVYKRTDTDRQGNPYPILYMKCTQPEVPKEKGLEYQDINAKTIDQWVTEGWEWGVPISHEEYHRALAGDWHVVLTPNKLVPMEWFGDLAGKRVLGLASGGGQQMPLFAAAGAICTVLDYSEKQLESEGMVAEREGYTIEIIRADMTKPLPFPDESFDLIFHPVSNCYVEEVKPIFRECYRILTDGGILLAGLDNGMNFIFDDDESTIQNDLPFHPLKNPEQMKQLQETDSGVQFSHTMEEQIGGQLEAGFILTHIMEDTNSEGNLKTHNIPCFLATRAVKRKNWQPQHIK